MSTNATKVNSTTQVADASKDKNLEGQKPAKEEEKKKSKGRSVAGLRMIPAPMVPILPSYLSGALLDEKGDNRDLIGVIVTFTRYAQEIKFKVRDGDAVKELTPSEYEAFKQKYSRETKAKAEEDSARGVVKKYYHRCFISVPSIDVGAVRKLLVSKPPPIVKKMMDMSQDEFNKKFPNPRTIVEFWMNVPRTAIDATCKFATEDVGDANYMETLDEKFAEEQRLLSKAAKSANAARKPPATEKNVAGNVPQATNQKWDSEPTVHLIKEISPKIETIELTRVLSLIENQLTGHPQEEHTDIVSYALDKYQSSVSGKAPNLESYFEMKKRYAVMSTIILNNRIDQGKLGKIPRNWMDMLDEEEEKSSNIKPNVEIKNVEETVPPAEKAGEAGSF